MHYAILCITFIRFPKDSSIQIFLNWSSVSQPLRRGELSVPVSARVTRRPMPERRNLPQQRRTERLLQQSRHMRVSAGSVHYYYEVCFQMFMICTSELYSSSNLLIARNMCINKWCYMLLIFFLFTKPLHLCLICFVAGEGSGRVVGTWRATVFR